MKATFNAVCDKCEKFKPRCARVNVRGTTCYGDCEWRWMTLCHDCRRFLRGLYRLEQRHKTGERK